MGGAGSIAAMITILKNNNRRNLRKHFDRNNPYLGNGYKTTKPIFKKATKKQLQNIKEKLQKETKIIFRKRLTCTLFFILIALLFLL